FLKEFPTVPVLCMTATLPVERRRDLIDECNLTPFPKTPPADLVAIAEHSRYRIEWIEREQAEPAARQALDESKRVLWVSNRVDDCQTAYSLFDDSDDMDPTAVPTFCYHSRFRLSDRRTQHNNLIREFQDAARDDSKPFAV